MQCKGSPTAWVQLSATLNELNILKTFKVRVTLKRCIFYNIAICKSVYITIYSSTSSNLFVKLVYRSK